MLKISNVETFYGKIQALRGVDIEVNDGEIVSLIGSNGAGKSTLLMTISGVNKAKRGNIVFNGENIEDKQPHISFRERYGLGGYVLPERHVIAGAVTAFFPE